MTLTGALACGNPGPGTALPPGSSGQLITIAGYQYLPQVLPVTPGSTVLVRNDDPFLHSVTSEAAAGLHVPGAVAGVSFDTGPFAGAAGFAIPVAAVPGTRIPYYCTVHATEEGALVVTPP